MGTLERMEKEKMKEPRTRSALCVCHLFVLWSLEAEEKLTAACLPETGKREREGRTGVKGKAV